MVKMLSMRSEEMTDGMMTVDRPRPPREAKEALKRHGRIRPPEDLEDFARRLEQRYGWGLGPPVHENATAAERGARLLPEADRRGQSP